MIFEGILTEIKNVIVLISCDVNNWCVTRVTRIVTFLELTLITQFPVLDSAKQEFLGIVILYLFDLCRSGQIRLGVTFKKQISYLCYQKSIHFIF